MWQHGHAQVDANHPRAFGTCDRCGFLYNLFRLLYQWEWMGDKLENTRFRVCPKCMDIPHEFTRPLKLPADPLPVDDPRIEPYLIDEEGTAGVVSNLP